MDSDSSSGLQSQLASPRRSERLYVKIRVRLEWRLENKTRFTEETQTVVVNAHGGLVRLDAIPPLGQKVIVQNLSTNEMQEAMIVFMFRAKDGKFNVGIELTEQNPSFWRVSFPPEDWSPSHPDAKAQ
jgi:hypothetical protein